MTETSLCLTSKHAIPLEDPPEASLTFPRSRQFQDIALKNSKHPVGRNAVEQVYPCWNFEIDKIKNPIEGNGRSYPASMMTLVQSQGRQYAYWLLRFPSPALRHILSV